MERVRDDRLDMPDPKVLATSNITIEQLQELVRCFREMVE